MIRTVLGAMEIGRNAGLDESIKILNCFAKQCANNNVPIEIDSAYLYAAGKSEEYIGESNLNAKVSTKACPWGGMSLSASGVRFQLETSLKRLQAGSVDIFYLHGPDQNVSFTETLQEVNNLYNEKKFNEFGLSNFQAWQVSEICNLCAENNWLKPSVYQGMYSLLTRKVEKELIACLRYNNMRFYAYGPLAGGILSGKYSFDDVSKTSDGGRFFGKTPIKEKNRSTYWKREYFDAFEEINDSLIEAYGKNSVTVCEASLRWLYHHSALIDGDGVILGASKISQLENTLKFVKNGPLKQSVVDTIESTWEQTCQQSPRYWSL